MKNDRLSDFFHHIAWACWGQTCDCGSNPFNWLAKFLTPYMNGPQYFDDDDDDLRHNRWWGRAIAYIGEVFYRLGDRTMPQ